MALRNPIINDRGEAHPQAKFARFICFTRGDSRTGYPGPTAEAAYEWWAKSTRAGRWHKHTAGFDAKFVKTANVIVPAPATGSASHG
jgi:hypothetical protein